MERSTVSTTPQAPLPVAGKYATVRLSFAPSPALAGSSRSTARGGFFISLTNCCRQTTSPPFETGAPPDHCHGAACAVVRLLIWVSSSPLAQDSSWSRTALCAATRRHSRSVATRPSRPVSRAVPITARLHPRHHSSRLTSAVQRPHPSKTQPHFRPLTALK